MAGIVPRTVTPQTVAESVGTLEMEGSGLLVAGLPISTSDPIIDKDLVWHARRYACNVRAQGRLCDMMTPRKHPRATFVSNIY